MQARYADSIESLVRNNLQKIKTDMANEVIDAGRFDMETTMAERRVTLESMLQACPPWLPTLILICSSTVPDRVKRCVVHKFMLQESAPKSYPTSDPLLPQLCVPLGAHALSS